MCEWCGRAFLLRDQPHRGRRLWTVGAGICALLALLVGGIALLNGLGLAPRASSPTVVAAPPTPEPPSTPADTVEPLAEPTAEPVEFVRIANTAGQGVILRHDPSTSAARIVARAENTVLQVVGPDESADGRVWRQVQDAQGNRGWVPAEFLVPAAAPGAGPLPHRSSVHRML